MDEFLNDIATSYYWLLFLMSIISGLIAYYLPKAARGIGGVFSKRLKERNKKIKAQEDAIVEHLVNNSEEITEYWIEGLYHFGNFLMSWILGWVIISVSKPSPGIPSSISAFFLILGAVVTVFGVTSSLPKISRHWILAKRARRIRREVEESI